VADAGGRYPIVKEQMSKSSHFGGILIRDGGPRLIGSHLDDSTAAQIITAETPCLGEGCKMVFTAGNIWHHS
jgi:hypothetical protein